MTAKLLNSRPPTSAVFLSLLVVLGLISSNAVLAGDKPGPKQVLEAFLKADSVEKLLPLVADREAVEPAIRDYYKDGKRKPVIAQEIRIGGGGEIPGGLGLEAHLFWVKVGGRLIPASVEETKTGFKVDWPSFTQFHDRSLEKFFSDPRKESGQFRVQLRRSHYFGTGIPDLDRLQSYRVNSPIAPFEDAYVFVDKESEVGKGMLEEYAWDRDYRPVVELKWVEPPAGGGAPRIELVRIVRPKWRG